MFGLGFGELLIILVIGVPMLVVPWRVVSKAGYTGALSLLLLVPGINIVFAIWFAFARWPVLQELESLKQGGIPREIAISSRRREFRSP